MAAESGPGRTEITPPSGRIMVGDSRDLLRAMPERSFDCAVTSPPYWRLRDYGSPDQLGQEASPRAYVRALVGVLGEVRRVLKDEATLWLNLGDCYSTANHGADGYGLRRGDLMGLPWRVAFALQDDGWTLKSDIIWNKPNAIPENVRNRPTKSHEYLFMLSKGPAYRFDREAVREPHTMRPQRRLRQRSGVRTEAMRSDKKHMFRLRDESGVDGNPLGRNIRTVWDIPTRNFRGAHFATFPEALVEPCIKAGCPIGGTVLDPFFGAGTTGMVAWKSGRNFAGMEVNGDYAEMARARIMAAAGRSPEMLCRSLDVDESGYRLRGRAIPIREGAEGGSYNDGRGRGASRDALNDESKPDR